MNFKNLAVLAISIFILAACSKKMPNSFGTINKNYSCMGLLPIYNESTFTPAGDLLSGYINLEMYKSGVQEVLTPKDLEKIFKEDGNVYFPRRFSRALAIEYSALLGLDGALYGKVTSPDHSSSDSEGKQKLIDVEVHFVDVKSSDVLWSYTERTFMRPGQYNENMKEISRKIVRNLNSSGFKYVSKKMPCWDTKLADYLHNLPDLTREMFDSQSYEIGESGEQNVWLYLGNVFMTIGKRSMALANYKRFLKTNPASPYRPEVERQVSTLNK